MILLNNISWVGKGCEKLSRAPPAHLAHRLHDKTASKAGYISEHAINSSSDDSMLQKNIVKMASMPNELVGATGSRYWFKELIQDRQSTGPVWLATSEKPPLYV